MDGGLRARRCIALRGSPEETRSAAEGLVAALSDVLWVGPGEGSRARKLLGRAFDAVVLDFHEGLDADLLGLAQGFVWAGGALVLRMGHEMPRDARLAMPPYSPAEVGQRFAARLLARLDAEVPTPLSPIEHRPVGTEEQSRLVTKLVEQLIDPAPSLITVLADRGRGKSSALGLALSRLPRETNVIVTAESEGQAAEIFRFSEGRGRFRSIAELLHHDEHPEVLVVDEAAQIPVFVLERLSVRFPQAKIAFATTARGYEGTGRGFVLRFLAWAKKQPRPLHGHELHAPIRWDEGDPLERFVLDVLALDAEPAEPPGDGELRCERLDRDALDEVRLREVFGLLVHAHYRTTPSDLHRILDAPNLAVHVATIAGRVVGATLIAREGGLPEALCERLSRGLERVHGHALPDTLITHSGRPEAGALQMIRSVRIAVHPAARLRGIARALVDHVHKSYAPDLFGTLFGATPELLRFRRALGYRLVRVGMSRGRRSGEPAAVMVRPVSPRAVALVDELRASLRLNLPAQCELLEHDLALDPALAAAFAEDQPASIEPSAAQVEQAVHRYLNGPQPSDAVAWALERWVRAHPSALSALDPKTRAVVEGRVLERRAWTDLGVPVPWAMRALRPAMARLLEAAG